MIRLTILGNNSALPAHGRHPTAQIVEIKEQLFLMDCGEGTQIQMQRYHIRRNRIRYIFISHLHGDHYFGLIGLINSMGLLGRLEPLHLYGPAALKDIIELQLSVAGTLLPFSLHFHAIAPEASETLLDTADYCVRCFPVEHRIACHGFLFVLKEGRRKLLPEKAREFAIPLSCYDALKRGEDYYREDGTIVRNNRVTTAGRPEKMYAYCADTRYTESILPDIRHADLLYHESTFLKADGDKAYNRFHSTAEQAATIARKSQAKKLLLGHFSSRYKVLNEFIQEAQAIFTDTELSEEGKTYEI